MGQAAENLTPISLDVGQTIGALRDSKVRLSLMSVAAAGVSAAAAIDAVRRAATQADQVGVLADGTIGILSLACRDSDEGGGLEERFLHRLRTHPGFPRSPYGEVVAFRAVHRWAMELADDSDLIDQLFGQPSRYVALDGHMKT